MTQHSIGYLELLHVMSDIPELSANFMTQVREFFTVCNPRQVQLMPERFADVVTKFVAVHLKAKGSPLSAVGPLLSAVQKVRRSPEHLSGVHHEFVKMCLLAKCYHIAARVLDDDVLYLPEQDGGKVPELKIEHVLMYHYYGGMVYVGQVTFSLHLIDNACVCAPGCVGGFDISFSPSNFGEELCVCARACASAIYLFPSFSSACVRACVCACVRVYLDVRDRGVCSYACGCGCGCACACAVRARANGRF